MTPNEQTLLDRVAELELSLEAEGVVRRELQSTLDAEREKVKRVEDKLHAMYANHPEASCYGAMPKLRAQLTQLQALVRALPVYEADALITVDGDLDEIDRPALRSAVMELLEHRAALGATTPAQTDEQRFIEACCERPHDCKWGGTGGCGYEGRKPKGGDGENDDRQS